MLNENKIKKRVFSSDEMPVYIKDPLFTPFDNPPLLTYMMLPSIILLFYRSNCLIYSHAMCIMNIETYQVIDSIIRIFLVKKLNKCLSSMSTIFCNRFADTQGTIRTKYVIQGIMINVDGQMSNF